MLLLCYIDCFFVSFRRCVKKQRLGNLALPARSVLVTSDAVPVNGHHQQAPLTHIDRNRQDLDELAYGTRDEQVIDKLRNSKSQPAFGGNIDALGYLKDHDDANDTKRIPKRGKALDIDAPTVQKVSKPSAAILGEVKRDEPVMPVINFLKWYAKKYDITPEINIQIRQQFRKQYADGLRESEYESVAVLFNKPTLHKVS
ncbi:MAG: hypothetical protein ACWIPH_05915 [Ostreibacterium sp.]